MDAVVEQARLELWQARRVRQPCDAACLTFTKLAGWACDCRATSARQLYDCDMHPFRTSLQSCGAKDRFLHGRAGDAQISVGLLGSSTASDSLNSTHLFRPPSRAALISPRSSIVKNISYRHHCCTGALHSCIPRSVRLTAHHHSILFSLVSGPSYLLYTRSIHSSDTRILRSSYLEVRVRYPAVIIIHANDMQQRLCFANT